MILVLCILVLIAVLIFATGDITSIWNTIVGNANITWLLVTVGILLLYAMFNQLSIVMLTRRKYPDIPIVDLFCIAGSEYFFNGITPFSTGGQPFQVYALKQKEVKLSDSTSILLLNFLTYQIVMNVISAFSVILFYSNLKSDLPNLSFLVFVGFTINFSVMIFLVLLGTTKFMGKAVIGLIRLIARIPFLRKKMENSTGKFAAYVDDVQTAFKEMGRSKKVWLFCALTKALSLICYYSVPYFGFLTIGIDLGAENFVYVAAVASFTLTLTAWVPTPGASGGAELAFTTMFVGLGALAGGEHNPVGDPETARTLALSGMMVWRAFTYYFMMILGLAMYIIFDRRDRRAGRAVSSGGDGDPDA